MATKKKMLQAAAGQAGGASLDITEVFSTYLYDGTGSAQTITNDIDLAGEGGLVWVKERTAGGNRHGLYDTERGTGKEISSNLTDAQRTVTQTLTSFNNNGFSIGTDSTVSDNGRDFASWTFRKAPKFFDVVTWSGNGTAGRAISHDLGSVPGMIVVKNLTTSGSGFSDWRVWHRSESSKTATLNTTAAFSTTDAASKFGNGSSVVQPTSTEFTVAADYDVNRSGETYVAYVFAHNDGDGGFGPTGDQDIIKCGSYTGDGGAGTTEVNLGFEPQWILVKASSAVDNGFVIDNMRGWATHNNTANDAYLLPNATNAESTGGFLDITSTGFKTTLYTNVNVSGREYIYMAIRRGPLAPPEDATEVFDVQKDFLSAYSSAGNPVDMVLGRSTSTTQNWRNFARMIGGNFLVPNLTNAEASLPAGEVKWDSNSGFYQETNGTPNIWHQWKRAPGFFDVVAYTGTGVGGRTVSHNLGVVPEMIWTKARESTGDNGWVVYHKDSPSKRYNLETTGSSNATNYASLTSTSITLSDNTTNNTVNYISYLFASLDGISKVGSYTGNGSSMGDTQTIDCGFSSGARFVLIKRTSGTGEWFVFDTERGIVAGSDAYITLHSTAIQVSGGDYIDPHSSGFTVVQHPATETNTLGETYMFYAIA